jgi:hypothetical protein
MGNPVQVRDPCLSNDEHRKRELNYLAINKMLQSIDDSPFPIWVIISTETIVRFAYDISQFTENYSYWCGNPQARDLYTETEHMEIIAHFVILYAGSQILSPEHLAVWAKYAKFCTYRQIRSFFEQAALLWRRRCDLPLVDHLDSNSPEVLMNENDMIRTREYRFTDSMSIYDAEKVNVRQMGIQ